MSFLTQGKTNWKYILIVVILAAIVGGGIFGYCRWLKQKVSFLEFPEIKKPEKAEGDIEKYLHKDAILRGVEMPPEAGYKAISLEEAIRFAIQYLESKSVKEIKICETRWIVAPLGGFLIDGLGNFSIEGKEYSTFRIGIRDGSEGNAGEVFAFIARGEGEKGNVIWYPEPGPDFQPAKGEAFPEELIVYEFLVDRERFESLSDRFTQEETETETANWKTYSNAEVNFSFKYPPGWEIKQEYQYKSAACQVDPNCKGVRYIFLNRIDDTRPANMGEKDKFGIAINMPQCTGVKWSDLPGNNWICVFDENPETLEIFNQMLSTFTLY